MSDRPGQFRLGIAAGISLLVHLGVALALALEPGTANAAKIERAERPKVQLPKLMLGRQDSPHETMTWIGYTDPTPHEARQAPVEQAAMSPAPPAPPSVQTPPPKPQRSVSPEELAEALERAQEIRREVGRRFDASVMQAEQMAIRMAELIARAAKAVDEEQEKEEAPDRIAREEPVQPQPSPTSDTGNAEEQESDGTATTEPTKIQLGKPAVAQGLFIRTVRPSFRYLTRATARPSDPVLRIEFRRDGKVDDAQIERSSGNESVDRAIVDAAFMWTAEGERLEKLRDRETISIRIRISL